MAIRAKLLGAIRLPDTAFKENARTEVVTDIIAMQRRDPADQQKMQRLNAVEGNGGKSPNLLLKASGDNSLLASPTSVESTRFQAPFSNAQASPGPSMRVPRSRPIRRVWGEGEDTSVPTENIGTSAPYGNVLAERSTPRSGGVTSGAPRSRPWTVPAAAGRAARCPVLPSPPRTPVLAEIS
jgi:hypothetical protein